MTQKPLQCLGFSIFSYGVSPGYISRIADEHADVTDAHPPIAVGNKGGDSTNCAQNQWTYRAFNHGCYLHNNLMPARVTSNEAMNKVGKTLAVRK
jgi:hypothetical protein